MAKYKKMKNLTKKRIDKDLTQKELAVLVGVQKNSISAYECGERFPKVEILDKIADALDCSVSELVG